MSLYRIIVVIKYYITEVASDDLRDALSAIFGLSELKEITSDEEIEGPMKDQPLSADASPTALSPGYIADSDPEEDKEDPEEDPADHPADERQLMDNESDCLERKNRNHENQTRGAGARGAVHALREGETDQDPNNIKDEIKA
ncbi:hypothetical protein Tco_0977609 [Tanacetum coccineum]|uniref:Uncharacterized protein n=1 Tax=Tanacetum coccineum TaxID=301880 RepID=A0ABQ5EKT5_9ASTR